MWPWPPAASHTHTQGESYLMMGLKSARVVLERCTFRIFAPLLQITDETQRGQHEDEDGDEEQLQHMLLYQRCYYSARNQWGALQSTWTAGSQETRAVWCDMLTLSQTQAHTKEQTYYTTYMHRYIVCVLSVFLDAFMMEVMRKFIQSWGI